MMKRFIFSIFLLPLLLASPQTKAQGIMLTPKWTAQAQFTGYYVADKLGFYKEEGIDVCVQHPAISESSFSFMEKGRAPVVIMNLSYAFMERLAGARVVNVMQTSQENSLMLISHSPLKGEESLRNQKIAVWNHLSQKLLDRLAEHYALKQVEWIRFNSGVNVFLSGAADPCLVGSYNEYLQLSEYGMNVDSIYSIRLADYGYNLPEDGLYVTEEFYNQYPEVVRKLVKASMRGWAWANEHREEALDMVMEEVKKGNIGTNRYHQRKMLEEVLHLQVDQQSGQRTYRLSREGFARAAMILTPAGSASIRYEDFVK
ncbi:ABC transporter substrate-binding protein [Bacteroides cellulosilyticus]|uniref:ABC transporter substrate-binding protein n=1 Tax=Bacteroides cellulosilyticus TaxID=246787 RepID=UPI003568EDAF